MKLFVTNWQVLLLGFACVVCSGSHFHPRVKETPTVDNPNLKPKSKQELPTTVAPVVTVNTSQADKKADEIEISFVGDIIFGRYRDEGFDAIVDDPAALFADVKDLLSRADLTVGNLETPALPTLPKISPVKADYRFGATPKMIDALGQSGMDVVSLANNHMFDLGVSGQKATAGIVAQAGMRAIGAPTPNLPAIRVETVEVKGWRIGFIAVTNRMNHPSAAKALHTPFVDEKEMVQVIGPLVKQARPLHDLLIVFVHWGNEYSNIPGLVQKTAARFLIESGVDMVVGHHPHVLQGIERHRNGLIAYSLGNFVFDNLSGLPRQTGILTVRVSKGEHRSCISQVGFQPVLIKGQPYKRPVPSSGYLADAINQRMLEMSSALKTSWAQGADDLQMNEFACVKEDS